MAIEHPYYWSTALLHNFEGSGTTITDLSPTPKSTSSVNDNATQSATQPKTGAKSLALDGTGDWVEYASHADFDFGSGAFTVSLWWHPSVALANANLAGLNIPAAAANADVAWYVRQGSDGKVNGGIHIGTIQNNLQSTAVLSTGTWYHIEFSRDSSNVCRLFIDGVLATSQVTYAGAINAPSGRVMRIGKYSAASPFEANGYIDGLVITKGYAVNTATFTPSYDLYVASPPGTGDADFTIPMFTATSSGGASAAATLPMFTLSAKGGASAVFDIPMFGIRATGHDATGERSAAFDMPMFEIAASGGALARFTIPMFGIEASLTVPVSMSARVALPMFDIEASGTVGVAGNATLTLPMFDIESGGGGQASFEIPMFTGQSSGTVGAIGSASFVIPMFDIEAQATIGIVITARFTIPMFESVRPSSAHVNLPMFGIVAIGHATVDVTYEAYVMNLKPSNKAGINEVTRWTDVPFAGIVRHGNSYYGWGAQGLHLIGGDTDAGAPISWAWHTAITDFGSSDRKPIREILFRGRVGPTAVASVSIGERADVSYSYSTPRGQLAQNYRVKTGKGLKNAYYAFGLAGTDVGDIDSVSFEDGIGTGRRRT